jgi:hypothetical protein
LQVRYSIEIDDKRLKEKRMRSEIAIGYNFKGQLKLEWMNF